MLQEQVKKEEDQISIIIFKVGWEQFAIELLDVKEIIQAKQIRKLPGSLDYVDGIYNYRGEIIHVINLMKKLNLNDSILYDSKISDIDEHKNDHTKFIIILNFNNIHIGFLVNQIITVAQIDARDVVGLSPIFQTSLGLDYIKCIVKLKDRPRILLDLNKILAEVEQITIQKEIST